MSLYTFPVQILNLPLFITLHLVQQTYKYQTHQTFVHIHDISYHVFEHINHIRHVFQHIHRTRHVSKHISPYLRKTFFF